MPQARRLAELAPKIMNAFHDLGRQHPEGEKLSMRQFQALIILNANQKLTLTSFCDKLSLAASTGTELVNRMIVLGFIKKSAENKDQRQVILSLTPKGTELLECRQAALARMFETFLTPFSDADKDEFIESFDRIWQLIDKYHGD